MLIFPHYTVEENTGNKPIKNISTFCIKCIMENTFVFRVFSKLVDRLPNNYPEMYLKIYPSLLLLQKTYWSGLSPKALDPGDPGTSPYVFCDNQNIIHVHIGLRRDPVEHIYFYLLHEIGHLVALKKYGPKDKRWTDYKIAERYANQFAYRWLKILKKERFLEKK